MAGLVPAIHVFLLKARKKGVDARDKRGHDARVMAGCGFDRFHGIDLPGTVTPLALLPLASASLFRRTRVPAGGLILLAAGTR
jgi:hypothetical protein